MPTPPTDERRPGPAPQTRRASALASAQTPGAPSA